MIQVMWDVPAIDSQLFEFAGEKPWLLAPTDASCDSDSTYLYVERGPSIADLSIKDEDFQVDVQGGT